MFDETQQMFGVHARRVMNVRVYFTHIVKITMRNFRTFFSFRIPGVDQSTQRGEGGVNEYQQKQQSKQQQEYQQQK